MNFTPVVATQDESSHWYLIPKDQIKEFNDLSNRIIATDANDQDLIDDFEAKFGHYRTGGDLNNVQLYIEKE